MSAQLWLRRYARTDEGSGRGRLICLPHAGGSAPFYRPLALALEPGLAVFSVQYPGRQDRRGEPLVPGVAELADRLAEVILPLADQPLTFFGHSMGATVGFETIRRLEDRGARVDRFYASGRVAPSRQRLNERVHLAPDAEIMAELRTLDGTDTSLFDNPEMVALVMPALRNDYQAIERYRSEPGAVINSPVHALIGRDDAKVNDAEARAWAGHTRGPFELTTFTGGHFYLTQHVDRIAGLIRSTALSALT
ncbi:alpha/beta fold hydrolase [Winogradskya consettensis]|uniref:Oleoyl-ACP hydrolase n=1 Tax=Winogradskya consettensis TaxID=113560 RepID=A0A919SEQ0_9ACTN|nr:alpha/beta fold hydrolase [Actinoplanes consettensis]GIM69698.1 oleoyl-ACP hydrolase [Actinoplanes consettensis]